MPGFAECEYEAGDCVWFVESELLALFGIRCCCWIIWNDIMQVEREQNVGPRCDCEVVLLIEE